MMKRTISTLLLFAFLAVPALASAQAWSKKPPQIGRLYLKQEYWDYIKEAAKKYNLSPFLILAVCAIESRYDMDARSGHGKNIGLMQLHKDTARLYGVNPYNPRENIMGGAAVLAKFMERYHGDIHMVLRKYNASWNASYEREVLRAYQQALSGELELIKEARN
jgi:soluble lytic murein transglycosylase-like protein|uniref:Transglycosylase SLT domain-containing protein n=1 Tax=Desulfobacca acetoxidans TaxID=60893 RepID=A0A7V6A3K9_9BACT